MTPGNDVIRQGLNKALGAVFVADAAGCTIKRVELTSRNPIVEIDGPGSLIETEMFSAAATMTMPNGQRRRVMAANLNGCQLQWLVHDFAAREVA